MTFLTESLADLCNYGQLLRIHFDSSCNEQLKGVFIRPEIFGKEFKDEGIGFVGNGAPRDTSARFLGAVRYISARLRPPEVLHGRKMGRKMW